MKTSLATFAQKITFLNQTTLDSMVEKNKKKIIKNFTEAGIRILEADFGWTWWKFRDDQEYKLAYKSPGTPYTPTVPRENAGNYIALKTKKPFFDSDIKKENYEFDILRYLKSYIIIPIHYNEFIYGNLVLCFKKQHNFTPDELALAQAIGNAIAQAKTIRRLLESEQKARIISQKQEEHFRALVENSYEIIVHMDEKGKILYVSPSVKKMLGVDFKYLAGRNISEFAKDIGPLKAANYIKKILNNPHKRHVEEFRYKTKRGDTLFFQSTSTKMPSGEGGGGIVVNIRDITEHKKLEEVKNAERQLIEEKIKVDSIADATHELRTPLAIIKGNVDLAKQGEKNLKSLKSIIKDIDQEVIHLSDIISDLALITSRPRGAANLISKGEVNVKELVLESALRCQSLAYKKHITITAKNIHTVDIRGDKEYLQKMLINLIKNSIHYGHQNGHTRITTAVSKGFVTIHVADDGIGISKDNLPHIFERFYRGDKSHSSEGTGLGLSIVKWIVETHKGKVSVKSVLNKGSIFSIRLPVKKS